MKDVLNRFLVTQIILIYYNPLEMKQCVNKKMLNNVKHVDINTEMLKNATCVNEFYQIILLNLLFSGVLSVDMYYVKNALS